ncbi:MAG: ABC transporter ATP-binding protein [Planctomycetes bacterium]|nr:ABC transporter ATP-binding protein [Planctomycetota bacterium]
MITARNLVKRYRKDESVVEALAGVSLEVAKGEFVVVRGKSGSGKTTLLNVLAGLARPSAGEVEVAGVRIDRLDGAGSAAFRAKHVGVVFQMFHLIPYLGLLENVMLPCMAPGNGTSRGELLERAREILKEFGLAERATHLPGECSAGERQRTALARAILRKPELLLADEPTGNLDPENARTVLDCMKRYQAQGGTILLVTHHQLPGLEDVKIRDIEMVGGRIAGAPLEALAQA